MGRKLTSAALVAEMTAVLGWKMASRRIGQVALLGLMYDVRTERDIIEATTCGLSTASRYRVVADLRRVREHLIALGYDLTPESDSFALVRALA